MPFVFTYKSRKYLPNVIEVETSALACERLQAIATQRGLGELEFEDYGDEVHAFTRTGKRRRAFAYLQFE